METKDFTALGGLFQIIIEDLKSGIPAWEDFLGKASKFHSQLKSTLHASGTFLDSFQKVADMATSARGATKDIGTALTRLCLRHRSVETKFKTYASAFMDCLILPLQDQMEEWKKTTYQLDKDYNKEYKRVRQEIKKKSTDTLKLQKKVHKVGIYDIKRTLDSALQDVNDKYLLLKETEEQAIRKALIEERSRFCILVTFIEPVVKSELVMLQEMMHLQEVLESLTSLTKDPYSLPTSSEEILSHMKNSESSWSFQTPPSSPSSLGSRKSSVCSISSLNSSSSNGNHSRSSSHRTHQWSLRQTSSLSKYSSISVDACSTATSPVMSVTPVTATWPTLQDSLQNEQANPSSAKYQRPHTISSAYERSGHNRPAITTQTFQPFVQEKCLSVCKEDYCDIDNFPEDISKHHERHKDYISLYNKNDRRNDSLSPPIPERSTSKEQIKPYLPDKSPFVKAKHIQQLLMYGSPSKSISVPDFNKAPSDQVIPNPIYANLNDLCMRIASKTASLPTRHHSYNKLTFHKDTPSVLTRSFVQQHSNSDDELIKQEINKQSAENISSEAISDNDLWEWWYLSAFDDGQPFIFDSVQQNSASFAGFSNVQGLLTNKGSSGQKGGNSNKPPTPIRRSSSISSQSLEKLAVQRKEPETYNKTLPKTVQSDDCHKSENYQLKENLSKQNVHNLPFSEDSKDSSDCNKTQKLTSWEEKDFGGDVFESRSRFLQALNATLTFQNRQRQQNYKQTDDSVLRQSSEGRKQIQAMVLQFQNQEQSQKSFQKQQGVHKTDMSEELSQKTGPLKQKYKSNFTKLTGDTNKQNKNLLTESNRDAEKKYNSRGENFVQSVSSKFPQQTSSHQSPRKASLPDPTCRSQSTSAYKNSEYWQKHAPQPAIQMKLSAQLEKSESPHHHYHHRHSSVESKYLKQNFLMSLNAKLSKQNQLDQKGYNYSTKENVRDYISFRHDNHLSNYSWNRKHSVDNNYTDTPTAKVQRWLSRRDSTVISSCCETLMDQIRRGTTLRKVMCNDRSAPRIS